MKKFISLLLSIVIIISLSACGEPARTGMKVDEFVKEYSSLQNEDSIINELFDITLADAEVTKEPDTNQNIYSFNLSNSDSLSRTMVEMTVKTDKNDYVDSVKIKMDESGIMYYSQGDSQFTNILLYYTLVLHSLSDLSGEESVEKVQELFNQTGSNRYLEINDTLRMRLDFATSSHTFSIYVNEKD